MVSKLYFKITYSSTQTMLPKLLLTGASGMVGKRFHQLYTHKYTIIKLSRYSREGYSLWNPDLGEIDKNALFDIDYLVSLAGENIAKKYWTDNRKKKLLESRINSVTTLIDNFKKLRVTPKHVVAASAIGFYGDSGNAVVDEESEAGEGYLADTTQLWEQASARFDDELNISTTKLRIGVVLDKKEGALPPLLLPTYFKVAPVFLKGKAALSWVHVDDLCHAIHFAIQHKLEGTYNITAPETTTYKGFYKIVATLQKKWLLIINVPTMLVRPLFGELFTLFSNSNCCSSAKIVNAGFTFAYPTLSGALKHLLEIKK